MPPVPQQPILLVGSEEMKGTRVTLSASERDAIVRPLDGTPTEELAFHAVTDPWTVNIKGTDLFQLSGISAVFLNRPTKTSVVLSFTLVVTAWQGKGAGDGATLWVIPTDAGYNPLSDRVQTSVLLLNPAPAPVPTIMELTLDASLWNLIENCIFVAYCAGTYIPVPLTP